MSFAKTFFAEQKWGIISQWKADTCKHIHETPDLRLFSCYLCLRVSVCWCVFWKIWKEKKSDIRKGWKEHRWKLTMTILNSWKEVLLLWKQVCTDTLPEVQRSRILSRVIPQLAEFLVILPSKRKHQCVSNRIKLWSHRCFFWKGHWSRCQ